VPRRVGSPYPPGDAAPIAYNIVFSFFALATYVSLDTVLSLRCNRRGGHRSTGIWAGGHEPRRHAVLSSRGLPVT
jgi:hypothetical protein